METIRKNKESMLFIIKEIANNYNVTNYEISKNTGVSEAALSKIMRGIVKNPRKNVIDAIYNYLTTHYPHDGTTQNTQNNNNGDNNVYTNSTGKTTAQQETTGQDKINENNIYIEMIATQRELISQYRKEIEYLRRKLKENTENS